MGSIQFVSGWVKRSGPMQAIVLSLGCVALATLVRLLLHPLLPRGAGVFSAFYPAILFATLVGTARAGILALVASTVVAWFLFMLPAHGDELYSVGQGMRFAVFMAASAAIIWGAEKYRKKSARLREEEHQRKMVVEELNHRVKNKLATVYAILHRELRNNPEIWENIAGRLRALTHADEFIGRSSDEQVALREILEMELAPYAISHANIDIEDVKVPSKPATMLALIFHELATNAAKYGAFSMARGVVTVHGRKEGNTVEIRWTENGGPYVKPSQLRGFGMTLLERGLTPYSGKTDIRFDPGGFSCVIRFDLPRANKPVTPAGAIPLHGAVGAR